MIERWNWGDGVEQLREVLQAGGLVAIPTESSYAIGADPENEEGVARVYELKRRPLEKPLPIVAADLAMLNRLGVATDKLFGLEAAWPGPLTVVAPTRRSLPVGRGHHEVAVRIPACSRLRALLADLDLALTSTSANRSGESPIVDPDLLSGLLRTTRAPVVIVDDGPLPGGLASTVVRVRKGWVEILRPGAFDRAAIQRLVPSFEISQRAFSAAPVEILAEESA